MSIRILFALMLCTSFCHAAEGEKTSGPAKEAKQEKAEWVARCDRVAEDKRVECLEKLRAEALERFLRNEAAKTEAGKTSAGQPG